GKTTHLYTEKEGAIQEGDASTKALVKSGDVDWVLHRQSPDSEVCNLYAHYYGPSASYLKFNKLDIGGYNLWDATKYGTIPGRTIGFNGSYVNYYCFIAEVYVPINVSKVAIRQYGLQVYQIPSGVWTVPGMGGSYINVDPYW
ncbi:MAG: hypothetical protein K0Q48_2805, partial [Bacillota bacterium]|nr:hypothetical protein [Bacillota bacterium]